jgi:hypothetical protein
MASRLMVIELKLTYMISYVCLRVRLGEMESHGQGLVFQRWRRVPRPPPRCAFLTASAVCRFNHCRWEKGRACIRSQTKRLIAIDVLTLRLAASAWSVFVTYRSGMVASKCDAVVSGGEGFSADDVTTWRGASRIERIRGETLSG